MSTKQKGFIQIPFLLAIFGLLFISSIIPVKRNYNDGKSAVAGVFLAKGGNEDNSGRGSEDSTFNRSTPGVAVSSQTEEAETKKVEPDEIETETEIKEVENELGKEDVKIATAPGQKALVEKRAGALTNFPLSVNPTTKQLTVTTPAGTKVVAVLPQAAINNMLASHVMNDVVNEKVANNLASIPEMVKLEVENGVLGYKIQGTKNHKLLGFIPLKTGVEAFVSAENGQVVETSESLLGKILDRIAP